MYGLQCDKCLSAYFNMTSLEGCQPCKCDRFGALQSQCDAKGQCECKSFAKGIKCAMCKVRFFFHGFFPDNFA